IGPILDSSIYSETPSEEIIFTSFGGEPYKMPLYQMLKEIADESEDMIINVYSPAEHLPETSEHFRIIGYRENLYPEIAKAKAAIIHGGLTTLHEAVFFGKPVLMIIDPYHPEQGNNGRKVQDMNCGIMLSGDTITKESMQEALRKCLSMKPRDMSALYKKYCGIERATEIIEGFETKQSETKPADT
ncbi:MAG: glycosyl transferase family 28, partial [Methanocorpusculum sp.]|nr:glycosyl transferase family 28 [Methanocorpusculum sp.]